MRRRVGQGIGSDGGIGGVTNHAAIRSRTARSFAIGRLALKASPLAAALRRAQVAERVTTQSLSGNISEDYKVFGA